MKTLDRRQAMGRIIGIAGTVAGTALIGPKAMAATTCGGDTQIGIGSGGGGELGQNLLTYVTLDPMVVAQRAYAGYGRGGCMYGVFDAIIQELAVQGHEDACNFAAIPTNLAAYGGGGIAGWGTLCGCLNATAMAVNMLGGVDRTAVIRSVYRYYEKTPMPRGDQTFLTAIGAPTRNDDAGAPLTPEKIKQSVANSILCHTSVSLWSKASQYGSSHAAKLERCAQVTAEIAYVTVEFLNASLAGTLNSETQSPDNANCLGCHGSSKAEPNAYISTDVASQMECKTCHSPHDVEAGLSGVHEGATCGDCH